MAGYGYDLGLGGPEGAGDFIPFCSNGFPIDPACGALTGAWNWYPCLGFDSWPSQPGIGGFSPGHIVDPQNAKPPPAPYYQDAGEPGRADCHLQDAGPPVSLAFAYAYANGRVEIPLSGAATQGQHVGHTYLPAPQLNFVA